MTTTAVSMEHYRSVLALAIAQHIIDQADESRSTWQADIKALYQWEINGLCIAARVLELFPRETNFDIAWARHIMQRARTAIDSAPGIEHGTSPADPIHYYMQVDGYHDLKAIADGLDKIAKASHADAPKAQRLLKRLSALKVNTARMTAKRKPKAKR